MLYGKAKEVSTQLDKKTANAFYYQGVLQALLKELNEIATSAHTLPNRCTKMEASIKRATEIVEEKESE